MDTSLKRQNDHEILTTDKKRPQGPGGLDQEKQVTQRELECNSQNGAGAEAWGLEGGRRAHHLELNRQVFPVQQKSPSPLKTICAI